MAAIVRQAFAGGDCDRLRISNLPDSHDARDYRRIRRDSLHQQLRCLGSDRGLYIACKPPTLCHLSTSFMNLVAGNVIAFSEDKIKPPSAC